MKAALSSKPHSQPEPRRSRAKPQAVKLRNALALAEEQGLLAGPRTRVIRGRMPSALIDEVKRRTGITSDTELIEKALASVAVADDYWDWMKEHRGTIDPSLDLEY